MKVATSFLPKSYLYFQSLLKRVNLTKTELCTLRLKNLNQRLGHIEVHEKIFLMKKRRQLKNIGSAQKTRQKAMTDRQEVLRKETLFSVAGCSKRLFFSFFVMKT